MSREAMKHALEALELLARYENPSTKIQVRKPKDGGPIVTMYPHKVATEAAALLRERLAQPEQEPVAHTLNCVCGAVWDIKADGVEEMVHAPNPNLHSAECFEDYEKSTGMNQWQGLTDEEINSVRHNRDWTAPWTDETFTRAIEAKLREKNHG